MYKYLWYKNIAIILEKTKKVLLIKAYKLLQKSSKNI